MEKNTKKRENVSNYTYMLANSASRRQDGKKVQMRRDKKNLSRSCFAFRAATRLIADTTDTAELDARRRN